MYHIGIDIGGTNLKAGLTDETGRILAFCDRPLGEFHGPELFAGTLANLAGEVLEKANLSPREVDYVGMGLPGAVCGECVVYTCNIPMKDVPLGILFREHLDLPVLLGNDADCAAVGEYFCGSGRGTDHFMVVTLGTGIGGGIILNGRLYTAMGSAGEIGHMVIAQDGPLCSCGRRGCWETYASATGLIRMTRRSMEEHPESLMHRIAADAGGIDGRTPFEGAARKDPTALRVCEQYVSYLATGLVNLVNILQPEVIALGGGIAGAPDALLLSPLRKIVAEQSYSAHTGVSTRLVRAQLGNHAGLIGAALLKKAI